MEKFKRVISSIFSYRFSVIVILSIFVIHANCKEFGRGKSRYRAINSPQVKPFKNIHNSGGNNYYNTLSPNIVSDSGANAVKRKSNKEKDGHHEVKGGWSNKPEKEVDSTLDDLLEVLGPHLFLVPFVLKALPFAIPALPLSYILSRYAPATLPELITRLMELATQINEFLQQGNTGGGTEG